MISTETGKPIAQSEREWGLSIDQFRWYAEEARRIYGRIVEEPRARRSLRGSARAGRDRRGLHRLELPGRAGRPQGGAGARRRLLDHRPAVEPDAGDGDADGRLHPRRQPSRRHRNLVVGPTATTYAPIMASPAVRKVSLTGSTRVGQQMIRDAADTMKKVTMELGGNAPLIVFDDADLDAALNVSVPTKYANAGQVCVTPTASSSTRACTTPSSTASLQRAKALKLGDGLDPSVQMGPLINAGRPPRSRPSSPTR